MRKNPHVRICGGLGSATTLVYPTAEWGRCKTDLKDMTGNQAREVSERYAAIADGEKPGDPEIRQLRRAAKILNQSGETKFSTLQVAATLASEYEKAVVWLHGVEADAAEAEELATNALGCVLYAWYARDDKVFLKARTIAERLATLEVKYSPDAQTWNDYRAALTEYLEPEPSAGR